MPESQHDEEKKEREKVRTSVTLVCTPYYIYAGGLSTPRDLYPICHLTTRHRKKPAAASHTPPRATLRAIHTLGGELSSHTRHQSSGYHHFDLSLAAKYSCCVCLETVSLPCFGIYPGVLLFQSRQLLLSAFNLSKPCKLAFFSSSRTYFYAVN